MQEEIRLEGSKSAPGACERKNCMPMCSLSCEMKYMFDHSSVVRLMSWTKLAHVVQRLRHRAVQPPCAMERSLQVKLRADLSPVPQVRDYVF